jgi:hypothetical protein
VTLSLVTASLTRVYRDVCLVYLRIDGSTWLHRESEGLQYMRHDVLNRMLEWPSNHRRSHNDREISGNSWTTEIAFQQKCVPEGSISNATRPHA